MSKILAEYKLTSKEAAERIIAALARAGYNVDIFSVKPKTYLVCPFPRHLQIWDNGTLSITENRYVNIGMRATSYFLEEVTDASGHLIPVVGGGDGQVILTGEMTAPNMKSPLSVLQEAEALINGDREQDYGSVTTNFANIAKGWSVIFGCDVTPKQVGLAMTWLKMARETNKAKRDNIVDACGYLGLIEKLEKEGAGK